MNPNEEDASPVESEATAKPARRKRAVKAEAAEPSATAVETVEAPAAEAADAPKPARKRRTAAKPEASADAPPALVEQLPLVPLVTEPVAPPAPVAPVAPLAAAAAEAVGEPAPAAEAPQGGPEAPGEGGEGGEAGAEGRSERSRRRNRRDRRRNRGTEAAAGEAAAPADDDRDDEAEAEGEGEGEPIETLPPADVGEVFAQVLSGEFDTGAEPPAETADAPATPHKRVLRPDADAPKLHKVLAQAGIGSRRDMEQLIVEGKITVNGQPAHIGQRISFGDHIKVDGKPVKVRIVPPPPRVLAYHKPVGEVVTHDDPQHRPTVFRRLPRLQQGKWQSVGRLDLNTEGLLLFTNSGELANQLMHPRFGVEREYAVRVLGTLTEDDKAELLEGVTIDGQPASFKSIEDGGGEGANHWYRVVITEGRNREVRKLFEEVGLTVSRLIRIRYGTVVLPRGLKRGVWVDLSEEDVRTIRRLAGGGEGGQAREERGGRGGRNKQRNERNRGDNRNDRGPRNGPPRNERPPQQQQQPPRADRDDFDPDAEEEIDHSRIPNPLEQTFDKRFVQNPRTAVGGRGFRSGGGGFGSGGSAPGPKKGGGPKEPDPLQTSVGYIGADAFHRKGGRGGGGRGGNRGGGGGGFGGGGGGRRGR